jgi:hypothetical protein
VGDAVTLDQDVRDRLLGRVDDRPTDDDVALAYFAVAGIVPLSETLTLAVGRCLAELHELRAAAKRTDRAERVGVDRFIGSLVHRGTVDEFMDEIS